MRDLETSLPFIQHLRVEHAHLNDALRELRGVLFAQPTNDTKPTDWQHDVAKAIAALREKLAHHFAEEDRGGCMEEAVCRCPSLAGEAELLEKEHPQLLAHADQLLALAKGRRHGAVPADQIRAQFTEFSKALTTHECREHHLLERGFSYASDDFDPLPAVGPAKTAK